MTQFTISGYGNEANFRFKKIRFSLDEALLIFHDNLKHYASMYISQSSLDKPKREIILKATNGNYKKGDEHE